MTPMGREIAITCAAAIAIIAQSAPTFFTDVDVVRVTATVSDRSGRYVTGLTKDDFSVLEDGHPREVLRIAGESDPVSLGILFDASGSMSPGKVRLARDSVSQLVTHGLRDADEWFLARFGFSLVVIADWTTDRDAVVQPLREITHTTGDTALYDAVGLSIPLMEMGQHEKRSLLVVSDGGETKSLLSLEKLKQVIGENDVRVYAIGVDSVDARAGQRLRMQTLRRIAAETGGRAEAVSEPSGARDAADRIADELRHQYLLTFSTTVAKDGRAHAIQVVVRRRGATVRARASFVAN
jgi:Ca-activated chloride channel family protein